MTRPSRVFAPPSGWSGFPDSAALTELIWERCRGWHYMNPAFGMSIWEDPAGSGDTIYVAYDGDDIVELVIGGAEGSPTAGVAAELELRFGVRAIG